MIKLEPTPEPTAYERKLAASGECSWEASEARYKMWSWKLEQSTGESDD